MENASASPHRRTYMYVHEYDGMCAFTAMGKHWKKQTWLALRKLNNNMVFELICKCEHVRVHWAHGAH